MNHYTASPTHYPLIYYVNLFYRILIPSVIGIFLILIALDVTRRKLDGRQRRKKEQ